ncbi:conserved hypothetical protein [Aspergillus terreus NIH2624]|uniref:Uncharacterized protein n=1 Tax=Aspergillus terreus (strain NIH 2624 / FGSC A1156) TaxID=341663 RepID=Q0CQ32_ASPTN|nr:uncharacterized protein ATEG_04202 [Aspergillus terreus NIH2624]EAU36004.1 conserved hypothetical protein [Aspergillus terreus NIH2624]
MSHTEPTAHSIRRRPHVRDDVTKASAPSRRMQVDARSIECEASVRRPPAEEKSPPANGVMLQADRKGRQGKTSMIRLTPIAKYSVSAIEPKYAAVKGRRGPETRCFAYTQAPGFSNVLAGDGEHDERRPSDWCGSTHTPSATHDKPYTASCRE